MHASARMERSNMVPIKHFIVSSQRRVMSMHVCVHLYWSPDLTSSFSSLADARIWKRHACTEQICKLLLQQASASHCIVENKGQSLKMTCGSHAGACRSWLLAGKHLQLAAVLHEIRRVAQCRRCILSPAASWGDHRSRGNEGVSKHCLLACIFVLISACVANHYSRR